jgi:hypothetical protein
MKTVSSMAFLLVTAFTSDAQITTSLNLLPNGTAEVRLRNDSHTSLIAYVVAVKQLARNRDNLNAPFIAYFDPLIEPTVTPVAPGEERLIVSRRPIPKRTNDPSVASVVDEPMPAAGIFADGATFGDAALIKSLILRRSNMLLAVETALDVLVDAGNRNMAREQLIKHFGKMSDYLNRWYVPPEQQVARSVYQSIVGKLMNLPEQPVGSAFPPSDFVAQETAALNRQRVMLLESQPSLEKATLIAP